MTSNAKAQQVVRAAIGAAGGVSKVAQHFDISAASVSGWLDRGSVPAARIAPLCELGGNVVTATQVLDALARENVQRAAFCAAAREGGV